MSHILRHLKISTIFTVENKQTNDLEKLGL